MPGARSAAGGMPAGKATADGALLEQEREGTVAQLLRRAEILEARNAIGDCMRLYERILHHEPNHPDALFRLGVVRAQRGELGVARALLESALRHRSNWPAALGALGNVHKLTGDAVAAVRCYREAVSLKPSSPYLRANLGAALSDLGRHGEAVAELRQALAQKGDLLDAHHHLGAALKALGERQAAGVSFRLALRQNAAHGPTLKRLVPLLLAQGEPVEVRSVCEQALALDPECSTAMVGLGLAWRALGEPQRALVQFRAAREQRPDDADLLNNMAIALQDLGRLPEALAAYEEALTIRADFPAARWHRALAYLLGADFERGWPDYELRLASQDPPPRKAPADRWEGGPVADKTVLVYAEQGLGDEIMFASCIPDVIARAGRCLIDCSPKLAALFQRSFPQAEVYGGPQVGEPSWQREALRPDLAIPAGSLPWHFRRTWGDFPNRRAYLRADARRVVHWRQRLDELGPGLKVGISWRGGTTRSRALIRSLALTQWIPLLTQPQVRFVSLQYTPCREELQRLERIHRISIAHWSDAIADYDETAALVTALDLVISVQTAVIHLAGALGRPTWVLVSASPEWRYLLRGDSLPWYPSVRLFRQRRLHHWEDVIEEVARELQKPIKAAARRQDIDEGAV